METDKENLARLQQAIQELHQCDATFHASVPVHEKFQGETVWQGEVYVFDLVNHPRATRCFAWNAGDPGKNKPDEFVSVLAIPPVNSARTAVQAAIMSRVGKKAKDA